MCIKFCASVVVMLWLCGLVFGQNLDLQGRLRMHAMQSHGVSCSTSLIEVAQQHRHIHACNWTHELTCLCTLSFPSQPSDNE